MTVVKYWVTIKITLRQSVIKQDYKTVDIIIKWCITFLSKRSIRYLQSHSPEPCEAYSEVIFV